MRVESLKAIDVDPHAKAGQFDQERHSTMDVRTQMQHELFRMTQHERERQAVQARLASTAAPRSFKSALAAPFRRWRADQVTVQPSPEPRPLVLHEQTV